MTEIPKFQTLYKRATSGATQEWDVSVEANSDGTADIVVVYGQQGGKKQVERETIREGKHAGKKNATTPLQQAISEAQSKWTKKRDRKHYGLTVEESADKRGEAPMLALVYEEERDKVDWGSSFEQPKLDGYRCLADRTEDDVLFWSREGKPFVLSHIRETLMSVMRPGDRFDGELYLHGLSINQIGSLVKKPRDETTQLCYNVYDSPVPLAFPERIALVQNRIGRRRQVGNVIVVETVPVRDEDSLMALQAQRLDAGLEGSMLRYGQLPYQAGRRAACLLKVKTFVDGEFLITGAKEGKGTHAGMAIFQCVTADGNPFECTAPGTHEEKRAFWENHQQYVGKMLTIKYAYMTATEKPVPWHLSAKSIKEPLV